MRLPREYYQLKQLIETHLPCPVGVSRPYWRCDEGVRFKRFGVQEVPVERVSASCCGTTGGNRTKGSIGKAHD